VKVVAAIGKARIYVFPDDHPPPHYHIVVEDRKIMVAIADGRVMRPDRLPRKVEREIAEAIRWGIENRELLAKRFAELNRRR